MRRVRGFPRWGGIAGLALVAALLVLVASDSGASATSFSPGYATRLSDADRLANANVTTTFTIPAPDAFFSAAIGSFPSESAGLDGVPGTGDEVAAPWGIANDAAIPNGAVGGGILAAATIGVLNSACSIPAPVSFTMLEGSTDQTTTVSYTGQFADLNVNGLRDGVDKYPSFLNTLFPPGVVGVPRERLFGNTVVAGTPVSLNQVIFEPGALALVAGLPASFGFPAVNVLQDPTGPNSVGFITDTCTPLLSVTTDRGITADNPATGANESGFVRLTNPAQNSSGAGPYIFNFLAVSERDAEPPCAFIPSPPAPPPGFYNCAGDGTPNQLDSCPLVANLDGDPRTVVPGLGPDFDGIDSACDPLPFVNNGPDADGDILFNRDDECPLVPDSTFVGPPLLFVEADSDGDGIGDACDPHPGVPDGHQHSVSAAQAVSIGKHGITLNSLGGAKKVQAGATHSYSADVSNKATTPQDVTVKLSAATNCSGGSVTINGPDTVTVSVPGSSSAQVSFSVSYGTCTDSSGTPDYVLTADACHATDTPAGGLFGTSTCPGTDTHNASDPDPSDDAPITKNVDEQ